MQSLTASDLAPSEAFVANSNVLKDMFNATTLTQLFSGSASSLKKIFKVSKVNFLLVCKEAMKVFKQEDGQIKQISHAHTIFNLVVPAGHNPNKEYEFKPGFSNMTDVNKGKVVQGRYCVWPVHNLRKPEQIVLYIQLEYKAGSKLQFERIRDKKAMEIIETIMANINERVSVFRKINGAQERSFKILDVCKYAIPLTSFSSPFLHDQAAAP